MPIDSRLTWDELPRKGGKKVTATLNCDQCGNLFTREVYIDEKATKENEWKMKEDMSNEISQHKH